MYVTSRELLKGIGPVYVGTQRVIGTMNILSRYMSTLSKKGKCVNQVV
jgi:hypothetical protein